MFDLKKPRHISTLPRWSEGCGAGAEAVERPGSVTVKVAVSACGYLLWMTGGFKLDLSPTVDGAGHQLCSVNCNVLKTSKPPP